MSHFTVLVKLSAARLKIHKGDVEAAVSDMLKPYQEEPEELSPYLEFKDCEEELRHDYTTSTVTAFRDLEGRLYSYNDRPKTPTDEIKVPASTRYPTYAAYVKKYHGYEFHGERAGYWHNPNAKWDWYSIGGRWSGFFPVKEGIVPTVGRPGTFDNKPEEGHADVTRFDAVDMAKVAQKSKEKAEAFWKEWQIWLEDPDDKRLDGFFGPRHRAIDLGLVDVVHGPAESTDNTKAIPWDRPGSHMDRGDERRAWTDVAKLMTRGDFTAVYGPAFYSLATYAALDDAGWHASGEMGWWGCSSDKPDDKVAFQKAFKEKFIESCAADDVLVIVDCHI
jgi:hypothetical protein